MSGNNQTGNISFICTLKCSRSFMGPGRLSSEDTQAFGNRQAKDRSWHDKNPSDNLNMEIKFNAVHTNAFVGLSWFGDGRVVLAPGRGLVVSNHHLHPRATGSRGCSSSRRPGLGWRSMSLGRASTNGLGAQCTQGRVVDAFEFGQSRRPRWHPRRDAQSLGGISTRDAPVVCSRTVMMV